MLGYCLNNSNTPFVLVEDNSYLKAGVHYVRWPVDVRLCFNPKQRWFGHSSHQCYSLVNTIGVMFKLGLRGLNGIKRGGVWWLKASVHLSSVVSQERPGLIESSAHAPSLSLQPTSTRTRGILRWAFPFKVVNNCYIKLPDEISVVDCIQLKNKATKRLKLTQYQANVNSTGTNVYIKS